MRDVALVVLLFQLAAIPAQATPLASLNWGSCPNLSRGNRGGSSPQTITVTASGFTGIVKSYRVELRLYAGGSGVPDAWRFDAQGCNTYGLTLNQGLAASSCPLLRGSHAVEAFTIQYETYGHGGWSDAIETLVYSALFDAKAVDPNKTYTLARFDVDFGSCGCIERPLCISMPPWELNYLDGNDQEHAIVTGNFSLNWNDPGNWLACGGVPCDLSPYPCVFGDDTLCVATPVLPRSWGNLKAGYR